MSANTEYYKLYRMTEDIHNRLAEVSERIDKTEEYLNQQESTNEGAQHKNLTPELALALSYVTTGLLQAFNDVNAQLTNVTTRLENIEQRLVIASSTSNESSDLTTDTECLIQVMKTITDDYRCQGCGQSAFGCVCKSCPECRLRFSDCKCIDNRILADLDRAYEHHRDYLLNGAAADDSVDISEVSELRDDSNDQYICDNCSYNPCKCEEESESDEPIDCTAGLTAHPFGEPKLRNTASTLDPVQSLLQNHPLFRSVNKNLDRMSRGETCYDVEDLKERRRNRSNDELEEQAAKYETDFTDGLIDSSAEYHSRHY